MASLMDEMACTVNFLRSRRPATSCLLIASSSEGTSTCAGGDRVRWALSGGGADMTRGARERVAGNPRHRAGGTGSVTLLPIMLSKAHEWVGMQRF